MNTRTKEKSRTNWPKSFMPFSRCAGKMTGAPNLSRLHRLIDHHLRRHAVSLIPFHHPTSLNLRSSPTMIRMACTTGEQSRCSNQRRREGPPRFSLQGLLLFLTSLIPESLRVITRCGFDGFCHFVFRFWERFRDGPANLTRAPMKTSVFLLCL